MAFLKFVTDVFRNDWYVIQDFLVIMNMYKKVLIDSNYIKRKCLTCFVLFLCSSVIKLIKRGSGPVDFSSDWVLILEGQVRIDLISQKNFQTLFSDGKIYI